MATGTEEPVNVTLSPFTGKEINIAARVIFAVVCSVMVVCGVLGNCLLITVIFCRFRRKRFVHNFFIANLALADVLTLGYWFTFFVLDLILGYHPIVDEAHCVVNGVFIAILCMVSTTSLMSISLNRYLHVCHSHLYGRIFTLPRTVLCCCLTWVLGLLLSLPPLFGHDDDGVDDGGGGQGTYQYSPETRVCSFDRENMTYPKGIVLVFSTLPMVLIGYCNFAIFRFWKAARISRAVRYPLLVTKEGREVGFVARWKARWWKGDVSSAQVNQGSETREDVRSHLEHIRDVPATTVEESSEACCAHTDYEGETQPQSCEHDDNCSKACTHGDNGIEPSHCHVHQEESSGVCADIDNVHEVEVSGSWDLLQGTLHNSAIIEPSAHKADKAGGECISQDVLKDDADTSITVDQRVAVTKQKAVGKGQAASPSQPSQQLNLKIHTVGDETEQMTVKEILDLSTSCGTGLTKNPTSPVRPCRETDRQPPPSPPPQRTTGTDTASSLSALPSAVITEPGSSASSNTLPSKFKQRKFHLSCRKQKPSTAMQNLRKRRRKQKAREVAFVRSLFVVWILMFVCFIPYGVSVVVSSYVTVPSEVVILGIILLFANNAVNWIVYGVMNPAFRKGYAKFLRRLFVMCCCVGRERADKMLNISQSSLVMGSQARLNTDNELELSCASQSPSGVL